MIVDWVAAQGLGRGRVTGIALSIGATAMVMAGDGGTIVVKVWPGTADRRTLTAQMAVQRAMPARGIPAPDLLCAPAALGPGWAVAMAYAAPGVPADTDRPAVRDAMAAGLARLVAAADDLRDLDGLPLRPLPSGDAIWPRPHSALFDFAATAHGAAWIDDIAAAVLSTLRSRAGRIVVGHCDWSARNLRMREDDDIAIVYDWDSVFLEREDVMLGTAAACFPADGAPPPSPAAVAAFVRAYERTRGIGFTPSERAGVAAGATYARAYAARCEHAIDPGRADWAGSSRESLAADGAFRL